VEEAFPVLPSSLAAGYASQQPYFISANGYTLYNASGILVGQKLPQEAQIDLVFKQFVYYRVSEITIEFIPNRI
jgi:hypothetical protein